MRKATILSASHLDPLADVPPDSPLVLDFGAAAYDEASVRYCERLGYRVARLLVQLPGLGDPALETYLGQSVGTVVAVEAAPDFPEAIAAAPRLARPQLQLELPLEKDRDLDVLKVLSSLGVAARLPLAALASGSELVADAMVDAVVRPGRRAPLAPFADLGQGFFDDGFELARLDFRGNDHHVDLRGGAAVPPPAGWEAPDVFEKRVPFLMQRHACAFCEGLAYCHGYLFAPETYDRCRALFSEFMELFDGVHARQKSEQAPRGPAGKGREGCRC